MGVGQAFQPTKDRVSRDRVSRVRDAAITTKGRLESPPHISSHPQFMNTTGKELTVNAVAACAGPIEKTILDEVDDAVGSGAGYGGTIQFERGTAGGWFVICYTRDESVEGVFRSS